MFLIKLGVLKAGPVRTWFPPAIVSYHWRVPLPLAVKFAGVPLQMVGPAGTIGSSGVGLTVTRMLTRALVQSPTVDWT